MKPQRPADADLPHHLSTLALAAGALAVAVAAALMPSTAQAGPLYANFDPTVGGAGDYSHSDYADISADCNGYYCTFINSRSAGFSFTAASTGVAAYAYLPLHALSTITTGGAMERFFRIVISDTDGDVVAQGGLLGRHVPVGEMAVYEFELNRIIESGQTLSDETQLIAGRTYNAYFQQRFGAMSRTHWMDSDVVPEVGQATQYCRANIGGACAYASWSGGWSYPYGTDSQDPITDFLPALALTDGAGWTTPTAPPQAVPEPASLALVLGALAVAAGTPRRRRR